MEEELKQGGASMAVTNENKQEYITLLCEAKMIKNIRAQLSCFLEGFYSMISLDLIQLFTPKEIEILIAGLPDFKGLHLFSLK